MSELSPKESAINFTRWFAENTQFFTGGDVLEAFRHSKLPGSDQDWRNKWGAVITEGARQGWYVKAGRAAPKSKQSHTGSLVQWQSRLFKGEQSLSGETAKSQLDAIRKKFVTRKIDLATALWQAYELGIEQRE